MTRTLFTIICLMLCSWRGLCADAGLQTRALTCLDRAMAIADAAWQKSIRGTTENMWMADNHAVEGNDHSGSSDVWPYTAAIEAQCSILEALEAVKDIEPELYAEKSPLYLSRLRQLIDNLEYYRGTYRLSSYATSNKEWSVFAVPRAGERGKANVTGILNVYDDQMWLARELIRAYRLTGEKAYLDEATYLTDYVLEGWDCWRDADGNEYGGITWGPGYNSKHACSNAPIIQPLVWLHDIYKDSGSRVNYSYRNAQNYVEKKEIDRADYYLDFAKKVYDWQKSRLLHPTGVYWDMMGAVTGDIQVARGYRQHVDNGGPVGALISYNTGTMIAGASELYRVTGEKAYRDDINETSRASLNQFAKYVRKLGCYEFKTDNDAMNGFNTWFNDVLMRSYADAMPYADNNSPANGLNSFNTTLDYAFENHNRGNQLPIHLLDGWGDETRTKAFHQFAFASQYAVLARWLMQQAADNAGVTAEVIAGCNANDTDVYTLRGVRLGSSADISSSLPAGVYIVGKRKVLIANYNPQNETCNAPGTKGAKIKTKREAKIKRSVPSVRFFC